MGILKPAPHIKEIEDPAVVQSKYHYWRLRIFSSMFLGYIFYYFTRNSFTFAMPAIVQDLHFAKSELGIVMSVWAITYGFSKFISGVIGDRSNARYFMSIGLIITGVCNILFGFCSSLPLFIVCWGLNGWFQGFGWPACARLLTHWYSQNERGRWWSIWNTSHNIGGAVVPLVIVMLAQYFGWRYAMIIPGTASIFMALILMQSLGDTPQSVGLPQIEKFRNDYSSKKNHNEAERELTVQEILFKYVLNNPYMWLLAVSYFFVYIIRMAITAWSVLYLVESKQYSQLQAVSIFFWYEIGGIFGNLAAGYISDKVFNGRRGPVTAIFAFSVMIVLLFFSNFSDRVQLVDSILIFSTGFFIYGPQMLIGMAAAELSHKKAAATASGFTGWIAYLGSAFAGYPLSMITQSYGWVGFFTALVICALTAMLLLLPLWRLRSRDDVAAEKEEVVDADLEPAAG